MTTLDDKALIQSFLTGKADLLANQNLRVESIFNAQQLVAKKGELIASVKLAGKIRTALVRNESGYRELMHQALQDNGFVPMGESTRRGFLKYDQYELPPGYRMHCTEARFLWKAWWLARRGQHYRQPNPSLYIFSQGAWELIQDISWNPGLFFIKTNNNTELRLESSDYVVWLSKIPPRDSEPESEQGSPDKVPNQAGAQTVGLDPAKANPAAKQPNSGSSHAVKSSPYTKLRQASEHFLGGIVRDRTAETPFDLSLPGNLNAVVKFHQGQLHINTSVGEIVVEGANLRFWLS
ncbi:hypothetical protein [Leptolyngbya sp. FACHB-261]|uniref:hypothetical protein n=1 Tax=Leptolyngbya sp. FACHB-261 TaxID=2692806 RepID=UPI00168740FA|nr:hypothetical protein [Leptolyngbya sp. FACHB-261]MBD2104809.1 hypothetical protein [Leptolyngbya sp. FACHB-261]